MSKIWLVAKTTFLRHIRSSTFLILTFGVPVLMVIAGALPWLREGDTALPAVGYVDQSGLLASADEITADISLRPTVYASPADAQEAFEAGQIRAYVVIPADYGVGDSVIYYSDAEPTSAIQSALSEFMRAAQLPGAPEWVLQRLAEPSHTTFVSPDGRLSVDGNTGMVVRILFPILLGIMFSLAVVTGVSQMGSAIIREKEHRAMEIVITSLPPEALVAGKVLGLSLMALGQIAVWTIFGIGAGLLAVASTGPVTLAIIPWAALLWSLVLGLPTFLVYAMLAAGVGVIAGDDQQSQQLAGILSLVGFLPFWTLPVIISAPGGTLSTILTLFPLTSPTVVLFRLGFGTVPLWQPLAALSIALLCLAAITWLVTRVFRAAMLIYGQRLTLRQGVGCAAQRLMPARERSEYHA